MKISSSLSALLLIGCISCTMSRDGRRLKKATTDWRRSPVVMRGYLDSPFGSTLLILHENKKFELSSSGFFMVWYQAGSWEEKQDTITLGFVNSTKDVTEHRIAVANQTKFSLTLYGSDTVKMRLLK